MDMMLLFFIISVHALNSVRGRLKLSTSRDTAGVLPGLR